MHVMDDMRPDSPPSCDIVHLSKYPISVQKSTPYTNRNEK